MEVGDQAKHGSVEGTIALPQGGCSWVVNIDQAKEFRGCVCVCGSSDHTLEK